ncbi:TolC family protein, partial [Petrachloros mirabilis]
MDQRSTASFWRKMLLAIGFSLLFNFNLGLAPESAIAQTEERREALSLADAAIRALKNNLDISISRQTKESRLTDIIVEQAKFDPTLSVNGQYNRQVSPLNRPVFGGTGFFLNEIQPFDQRSTSVTLDAQTNLITGGNIDLNYSPNRTNV